MNRRAKRRLWLLSVLAILGAATLACWVLFASWNRERRIQTSIDDGMAAYERGDYVNALNIFEGYALGKTQAAVDALYSCADYLDW